MRYDRELMCWTARRNIGEGELYLPVRSYRELRRVVNFGSDLKDTALVWLNAIDDCTMLYDIGSANGLEGVFANSIYSCKVAFVEIFAPSIEDILKAVVLAQRSGHDASEFEVFNAGADSKEGYGSTYLHEPPVPGSTYTSFAEPEAYARGGRSDERV